MGKLQWYKRYPDAALNGMFELTLEERGAYNTILDIIYSRDGACPDEDRYIAGMMCVDVRKWRRIRTRLLALGKLYKDGDHLRNSRADTEVDRGLRRIASSREAGLASGASRRQKSAQQSNVHNGLDRTDVPTDSERSLEPKQNLDTDIEGREERTSTSRESLPRVSAAARPDDEPRDKNGRPYAFLGKVLKIDEDDYAAWEKAYPNLDNLRGMLQSRDDWLRELPAEQRGNVFFSTSAWLRNQDKEAAAVDRMGDGYL